MAVQNFEDKKATKASTMEGVDLNEIEIVGLEEIKPDYTLNKTIHHTLEDEFATEIGQLKSLPVEEKEIDENLNFD